MPSRVAATSCLTMTSKTRLAPRAWLLSWRMAAGVWVRVLERSGLPANCCSARQQHRCTCTFFSVLRLSLFDWSKPYLSQKKVGNNKQIQCSVRLHANPLLVRHTKCGQPLFCVTLFSGLREMCLLALMASGPRFGSRWWGTRPRTTRSTPFTQ